MGRADERNIDPCITTEIMVIMARIYPELMELKSRQRPIHVPDRWRGRTTELDYTPLLIQAAKTLDTKNFRILVGLAAKQGAVDIRSKDGETALHKVLDAEFIEILVAAGADINAKDNDGDTPLHASLYDLDGNVSREKRFNALIGHGANVNVENNEGQTPLDIIRTAIENRRAFLPRIIGDGESRKDTGDSAFADYIRTADREYRKRIEAQKENVVTTEAVEEVGNDNEIEVEGGNVSEIEVDGGNEIEVSHIRRLAEDSEVQPGSQDVSIVANIGLILSVLLFVLYWIVRRIVLSREESQNPRISRVSRQQSTRFRLSRDFTFSVSEMA